ncbi:ROK family transcriptional regulator [Streptomyces corynorhini]|uniref:ROK family transcriptional regulator n=1 Tax=Streptomyces corynorhini TaxID=2282652 RepID=A0A370B586_9ACTN|nr:ROK family transcriptional regulator [Streptomyces corynorhini]RDG36978.1 ROK family transcriptional regulator [Streptomyces corynorhini]
MSERVSVPYRVLSLLRDNGPLSRAQLSDRLEIPRPRLLAELDRMVAAGKVLEAGPAASRGGRRSTLVQLDPGLRFAAVDLGASSLDIEITDGGLEPVASYSEAADIRSGPVAVLDRVSEILHGLAAQGHYTRLDAIGIGLPGPVSFRDGVPVSPPIMVGWNRYPVRDTLAREHGCPVVVDNDVNVMALGERHSGVARTVEHLLFVKIGSGIGSGMQHHGRIYRGAEGCAGDIGHIQIEAGGPVCTCGNTGCLEAYFGGVALARDATAAARSGQSPALAERLAERGTLSAVDVAECATSGDTACVTLIRDGGHRVGQVLATLVSFMNPSMIVIGGGLTGLGYVLLSEIRSVVYKRSLPLATGNLPIVMSELGPRAGVVGAALLASELSYGGQPGQPRDPVAPAASGHL